MLLGSRGPGRSLRINMKSLSWKDLAVLVETLLVETLIVETLATRAPGNHGPARR